MNISEHFRLLSRSIVETKSQNPTKFQCNVCEEVMLQVMQCTKCYKFQCCRTCLNNVNEVCKLCQGALVKQPKADFTILKMQARCHSCDKLDTLRLLLSHVEMCFSKLSSHLNRLQAITNQVQPFLDNLSEQAVALDDEAKRLRQLTYKAFVWRVDNVGQFVKGSQVLSPTFRGTRNGPEMTMNLKVIDGSGTVVIEVVTKVDMFARDYPLVNMKIEIVSLKKTRDSLQRLVNDKKDQDQTLSVTFQEEFDFLKSADFVDHVENCLFVRFQLLPQN